MSAKQLGIVTIEGPNATVEVNEDSGVTHVIPKTMPRSVALDPATHPPLRTALSVMGSFVYLKGYSIRLVEGDLAEVEYRYGQSIDSSDPTANQPGSEMYPGRPATPITEFYETENTLETISILRHPRYKNIGTSDQRILAMMIQLGPIDENGTARSESLEGQLAKECGAKIEAGVISYLAPKYVWRYRKLGGSWTAPGQPGKIMNPPGPAPNIQGNWLFMGTNASGWAGGVFEITQVWESSPSGDQWDAQLYSS
jgi:hypothetical protein